MKYSIAIVVVAYNRDKSLERLLQSLSCAFIGNETPLIISVDKSNNTKVAQVAKSFEWKFGKKEVVCHNENLGLRKHILGCGKLLDSYDAIIVLEDDLFVSKNFYSYTQQTVERYYSNNRVAGISLYSFGVNYQTFYNFIPQPSEFDTYFMQCAQSWGQVWMKNQWKEFEKWYSHHYNDNFDSEVLPESICSWSSKSWLKYHTRYCIETGKYFVYPYISLSSNCGETGTHLKFSSPVFQRPLADYKEPHQFNLSDLTEEVVKYDGFFEAECIYGSLGLSKSELCIDLTSSKSNYGNKRYLLTSKRLPFRVVDSFGISFTPIEMNVLNRCPGEFIFLYDTNASNSRPSIHNQISKRQKFAYDNNVDLFAVLRRLKEYGIISILKTVFKSL